MCEPWHHHAVMSLFGRQLHFLFYFIVTCISCFLFAENLWTHLLTINLFFYCLILAAFRTLMIISFKKPKLRQKKQSEASNYPFYSRSYLIFKFSSFLATVVYNTTFDLFFVVELWWITSFPNVTFERGDTSFPNVWLRHFRTC